MSDIGPDTKHDCLIGQSRFYVVSELAGAREYSTGSPCYIPAELLIVHHGALVVDRGGAALGNRRPKATLCTSHQ
jgi:hypothetical protein